MASSLIVCAVKDTASQGFNSPFFVPAAAVALRSFRAEVNRAASDNQLYQHPEDFELYGLGSFDQDTGAITAPGPVLISRAKDLRDPG